MCTVTFIARKNGYALGMNRDEKNSRVQGVAPSRHVLDGRAAIFPSEPSGGTWIGVNDAGVTFALINWYLIGKRVSRNPISRGEVTHSILAFDKLSAAEQHLARFPLDRINPFRLIGVFPQSTAIVEWRWDLVGLKRVEHRWQTSIWISSGFDERGAEITRRERFVAAQQNGSACDVRWLRQLHRSHEPAPSAYSICMHRDDARTVSYSEISVTDSIAGLTYSPSPLCCHPALPRPLVLRLS